MTNLSRIPPTSVLIGVALLALFTGNAKIIATRSLQSTQLQTGSDNNNDRISREASAYHRFLRPSSTNGVLRQSPAGPNPIHDNTVHRILRESPGGPDPIHDDNVLRSNIVDSILRESPGGPDPIHHFSFERSKINHVLEKNVDSSKPNHHSSIHHPFLQPNVNQIARENHGGSDQIRDKSIYS
ncbi:uncharacterized protein LOC113862256 [Abrus precatorius]|uniref:Uncharacterized protein LOC113862256 n=1 Tax=Abrus precatorius TaxID=3816 RepID=A0A8B8L4D1_ABRPR|nr:uncharacterized protein LOC113862256 [Abrus precatorius]